MKQSLIKYCESLTKILSYLEKKEVEKAKEMFNNNVYPLYKDSIMDTTNPISKFRWSFISLDKFLNNSNIEMLKFLDLNNVISDVLDDLEKIKEEVEKIDLLET